jgi:hypothetical protein
MRTVIAGGTGRLTPVSLSAGESRGQARPLFARRAARESSSD